MLYTVGNRVEYEKGIAERAAAGTRLLKFGMGQRDGQMYRGGAVWDQIDGARAFVAQHPDDGLGVFGVEADWDRDTLQYDEETFRRLIVARPLVKLSGEDITDGV